MVLNRMRSKTHSMTVIFCLFFMINFHTVLQTNLKCKYQITTFANITIGLDSIGLDSIGLDSIGLDSTEWQIVCKG